MGMWRGLVGGLLGLAAAALFAVVFVAFVYVPGLLPHPPVPPADAFTRADTITIVLTAVTVILAALAIVLALVGVFGYLQIKSAAKASARSVAEKAATEAAERIAREISTTVATREAEKYLATLQPGTTSADADAIAGAPANGGRDAGER
jgi:hypothetical protein